LNNGIKLALSRSQRGQLLKFASGRTG